MKKKKYYILVLTMLLLVAVLGTVSLSVFADTDDNVICNGVYINSLNVGNMTEQEAKSALDEYVSDLMSKKITVDVAGENVETTLKKLGLTLGEHNYIEEALAAGKSGNLIKRYKELKDIENNGLVFELDFAIDDTKLDAFLEECKAFDVEAQNAKVSRSNGQFIVTEHKSGQAVNLEETKALIKEALSNDWNYEDIAVTAVVEKTEPQVTKEEAARCQDLLGSFSTTYSASSSNRASNLTNGAKKINGTVVYPGETFSAYKVLSPFTTSNGWSAAGAYNNGKVVDSIGGGVCQVSTTLYNALLKAEMEIVERAPHSMTVSYVEPAMDAAIAGTWKDLKFKNNTDVPVYIESYTSGRTITFKIYGEETRPSNRTVKYVSEILEKTEPPADVITEDDTQPTSYKKVEQSAHYGYKANLWKIVYIDGVQQSKEKVNYSTYTAAPKYVTVGTKEEEPEPTEEPEETPNPDKTPKPEKTPKPDSTEKPGKTPKPTATPKPTKAPSTPKPTQTAEPSTDADASAEGADSNQ